MRVLNENINSEHEKPSSGECDNKLLPNNAHSEKMFKEPDKDFYTNLITRGRYVPADDTELKSVHDIPWFDKSLMEESVIFHENHFASELMTLMCVLLYGFAVKPNTAVLLRTGRLHDPQVSFQRYLSTNNRLVKFFNFNWNSDEAYQDFRVIRKMHVMASKKMQQSSHPTPVELKLDEPWKSEMVEAMRKDLQHLVDSSPPPPSGVLSQDDFLTWNPPVPISQFDMATTQLGLFGTMWLFPHVFGVKDREREMRGVIHSWAVYGKLLGIKDEFNICLQKDPYLFEKMFREIVLKSLQTMDETVVTIQAAFMEAFSKRTIFISYKSVVYFGLKNCEGYKGNNLRKIMTWKDKINCEFLQLVMWLIGNFTIFRILFGHIFKLWFQFNVWWYLSPKKGQLYKNV